MNKKSALRVLKPRKKRAQYAYATGQKRRSKERMIAKGWRGKRQEARGAERQGVAQSCKGNSSDATLSAARNSNDSIRCSLSRLLPPLSRITD